MLRCFFVPVSVVEDELVILDVLRYSVNFNLWLVHLNPWVEARNGVNLATERLLLEEGTLTHANANVHGGRGEMVQGPAYVLSLLVDHLIEVVVANLACGGSLLLPICLLLLHFLHGGATSLSLLLHLLDVVNNVGRLR